MIAALLFRVGARAITIMCFCALEYMYMYETHDSGLVRAGMRAGIYMTATTEWVDASPAFSTEVTSTYGPAPP